MTMAEINAALEPADRAREADEPHSLVVRFGAGRPLRLDAGVDLAPFQIAYQTYGTLNAERTNAVLLCHALTGDQHVFNFPQGTSADQIKSEIKAWVEAKHPGMDFDVDVNVSGDANVSGDGTQQQQIEVRIEGKGDEEK